MRRVKRPAGNRGDTQTQDIQRATVKMKLLKNPFVQTALVVVGVLIVLPFVRPMLTKIPLLNQI